MIATNSEIPLRIRLQSNSTVDYRRGLRLEVGGAVEKGVARIVVDCASWSELDLILLSSLVECAHICHERNVHFELENLGAEMRTRIGALGLGSHLRLDQ